MSTSDWTSELAEHRDALRTRAVSRRVVDLLREQVLAGKLAPGAQLTEEPLVDALGVSRNTVREALTLLSTEGLVEHKRHRGMFVRRLAVDELDQLCGIRRITECGALYEAALAPALEPARVRAVVEAGETARTARDAGDWAGVGDANTRLHRALTALAANPLADDAMASYLAQMRLAFLVLPSQQRMHEPYVEDNIRLAGIVADGAPASARTAAEELVAYLRRAQAHLVEVYRETAASWRD